MKKILSIFITLFFATEIYADTLNDVINKPFEKPLLQNEFDFTPLTTNDILSKFS